MRLLKAIRVWYRVMTDALLTPDRLRSAGLL